MNLKQARFLIVDDYDAVLVMVENNLRTNGITGELHFARNGKDALAVLLREEIEFIICDFVMPEMNGLEFLQKCREIEKYYKTPFLMLTAENDRDSVMSCIQSGVTNYMIKPWSPQTLMEKLNYCWEKARKSA